ncbi:MAG: 2,3-diphosphoglycerate synthetase, partial [Thermoleophilia bacterium]
AAELLGASRSGLHAASDYFEDAVLAGVTTVGCRRCGGGMAGASFDENVSRALGLVADLPVDVVVWEGSGAVIPPVAVQATACVASAAQPHETTTGYLGTYRMLISDLIVLTMCEPPYAGPDDVRALRAGIAEVAPSAPVVATVFRPRPQGELAGRRVAFFSTAAADAMPGLVGWLERRYGADVVVASPELGDRVALAAAVRRARSEADLFLTEIKAAAIDVVAEGAAAAGIELQFCDNEPVPVGDDDLAAAVERLIETAVGRPATGETT